MAVTNLLTRPSVALPVVALLAWVSYFVGIVIYRLYLSPIAKFPGPKLAALTRWYEFYYEVILKGQFTFHIDDIHSKYGPIVRITPEELHIKDSDYWEELYSKNPKADKYEWSAGRFGNNGSIFTTSSYALHRTRRGALNPMFSKRRIMDFQPVIQKKLDLVCSQLSRYKDSGEVLAINDVWSAFAGDVITEYSFGLCYNHLESSGCKENFHDAFMAVSEFGHVALQFPWVHPVLSLLPHSITEKMNPPLSMLLKLQRVRHLVERVGCGRLMIPLKDLRAIVSRIASGEDQAYKQSSHPTIFHEVLQSDLPPPEKALRRLGDEAQTIIGAGLETTAWALSTACFHIINQPRVYGRLRDELYKAMPDPSAPTDWLQLEKLPYLGACIREGIRLSYGVSARNSRVHDKPIIYKDWVIPARTPVSMTIIDVHHDEGLYPNSRSFIPERWLDNPRASNRSPLDRYFVAFSKGARSCLGINLAYAELYLALGTVFRRFRFELYETDVSDVGLAHDYFLPSPKLDSKGVRVKVKPL